MDTINYLGLVVFDLDGTLIDSGVQIAGALEAAITQAGLENLPSRPGLAVAVGPPLTTMAAYSLGLAAQDTRVLDVVSRFARLYDPVAAQACVFDGAHEVLHALCAAGFALALATNKRRAPTLSILQAHGWEAYFEAGVYGVEDFGPKARKSGALAQAFERAGRPSLCAMVGDTDSDLQACKGAHFDRFILARWGAMGWVPPVESVPFVYSPTDFSELVVMARTWL